ncbi:MAG: gas vesicle protein [Methanoregulaceae archaeon]|jgi:hypothetical protein
MEATRDSQATLVDLLDRVLEKGLVLHADVIISVSGIPLIGLKLSALLASVDTMIRYGLWVEWDSAIRAAALDEERQRKMKEQQSLHGEMPQLRSLCSCRQQNSSGEIWRPGTLYITGSRVVFTERTSSGVLFESDFAHLSGFSLQEGDAESMAVHYLDLILKDGTVVSLRSQDAPILVEEIGREMKQRNLAFEAKEGEMTGEDEGFAPSRDGRGSRPVKFREVDLIGVLCNER